MGNNIIIGLRQKEKGERVVTIHRSATETVRLAAAQYQCPACGRTKMGIRRAG
jgi:predicted RNA-binding Zn-ribbon protein involved in translation (DUF1610 family)